ncbi:hypothetical protein [Rufibacter psychrotolerans]|uniref:hypothetical protein n=1 Tax=Rufibacter psychrotolerans TaxID=2812556 RepID=UPI0019684F95|nr:hypothetical protein [Rufibacter sp. SYSU D00308]
MKAVRFLVLALGMLVGAPALAQAPDAALKDFLARFRQFEAQHQPKVHHSMPILAPGAATSAPIPNALRKDQGFMIDPVTRLQYYHQLGKVYDPETDYRISYDPKAKYRIDVEAGKVYRGGEEVKPGRGRPAKGDAS